MAVYQNVRDAEAVLKDIFLPAFNNQIGTSVCPFYNKIKKEKLKGDKIVATAPIGLSGGFGFGQEGEATPQAGRQLYQRFEVESKDMYVDVQISQKSVELCKGEGAMVDLLQHEIESAYRTAKWNVGRALFGNSTGKLAGVTAYSASGTTYTITVDGTNLLKEGLTIDVIDFDGSTLNAKLRIKSINRAENKIICEGTVTSNPANGDSIYIQNSMGRELTGLDSIFNSSITSIYGITKSSAPYINPLVFDAGGSIDDTVITNALRQSEWDKGGEIDTILCGQQAFDAYLEYARTDNRRIEERSHTLVGGFNAIEFIYGSRKADIVCEQFMPSNKMYCVNSQDFTLYQTDWKFAELQGGGIFNLMEGKSAYRALLCDFGDLVCKNPGACVEINNVA